MNTGVAGLPLQDLDLICEDLALHASSIQGKEILIYGGTGFIGSWLVAGLLHANDQIDLNAKITIVTRDVNKAKLHFNLRKEAKVKFEQFDLQTDIPKIQLSADIVFHAATPTMKSTGSNNSAAVIASTQHAAQHALTVKSRNTTKPIVIHLSSGSVFGTQPMEMENRGDLDQITSWSDSPYVHAKLLAEDILEKAYLDGLILFQSPRLFAFAGPLIPLDAHFAIGNFLRDGLGGGPINLLGSPETRRSYLYPSDLVNILLRTIHLEKFQSFNIGNDQGIRMFDLAELILQITGSQGIELQGNHIPPTNYVPGIDFVRNELNYQNLMPLDVSIERWLLWLRATS